MTEVRAVALQPTSNKAIAGRQVELTIGGGELLEPGLDFSRGNIGGRDDGQPDLRAIGGGGRGGIVRAGKIDRQVAEIANLIHIPCRREGVQADPARMGIGAEIISRTADILQSFPVFILAMALVAVTGPSPATIIVVLAFLTSPIYLRLMRTQTYALREAPFVEAARVIGNTRLKIVVKHILPLAVPPAIGQLSVNVGFAILITAGLSFVGAGVRVPTPEWGSMISVGSSTIMTGQWWTTLFPGLAIVVTVLGFSLVGDAVDIILDPRRR